MPLIYIIDKAARIVTIQYNKNPQFEEFERIMEAAFKDSDYESGFNFLLDRHLIDEPPSTEYIKRAVNFLRKHEVQLNHLAIVVNNMATYGMERMAQLLAEGVDVHLELFTDIEKARQWLRSLNST